MKVLAKKEKYKKQINGNTYREEIERREGGGHADTTHSLSPSTALSLSLQLTMYNYKGYKKREAI